MNNPIKAIKTAIIQPSTLKGSFRLSFGTFRTNLSSWSQSTVLLAITIVILLEVVLFGTLLDRQIKFGFLFAIGIIIALNIVFISRKPHPSIHSASPHSSIQPAIAFSKIPSVIPEKLKSFVVRYTPQFISIGVVIIVVMVSTMFSGQPISSATYTLSHSTLSLETNQNLPTVEFLDKNDKLLYFHESRIWVGYKGQEKRIVGIDGWFEESDEKIIEVSEDDDQYILKITRSNPTKDPSAISFILALSKTRDQLSHYVTVQAEDPNQLGRVEYLIHHLKMFDIYSPEGEYLKNDWNSRYQTRLIDTIPTPKNDYMFLIDPYSQLSLRIDMGDVEELGNLFDTSASAFFTSAREQIDGEVRYSPIFITVRQNSQAPDSHSVQNLKVTSLNKGSNIYFHHGTHNFATSSFGSNEVKFNGSFLNSFASEISPYAWFNGVEDTKLITVEETQDSYQLTSLVYGDSNGITGIQASYTLPKNDRYIKMQISVESTDLGLLEEAGYSLNTDYFDVYLPNGQILRNDRLTNYSDISLGGNHLALMDRDNVIIIASDKIERMNLAFETQALKLFVKEAEGKGKFKPLYIMYLPNSSVSHYEGNIALQTGDYIGTLVDFLEIALNEN